MHGLVAGAVRPPEQDRAIKRNDLDLASRARESGDQSKPLLDLANPRLSAPVLRANAPRFVMGQ